MSEPKKELPEQSHLERQILQQFDADADGIDGDTLSRIRQARYRALDRLATKPSFQRWLQSHQRGLAVAASLALVAVIIGRSSHEINNPTGENMPPSLLTDNDVTEMLMDQPLQLYEDLDFYRWLAEDELGLEGLEGLTEGNQDAG